MRTASGTGEAIPRWQTVLGAILAVGGAGVLVAAALGTRLSNQATVAAGAAALVIGAFLLLPTLAQVPVWLLSLGTERRGLIRHLAAINLHRQPRRLRAAAASLMVGLAALTALGTVDVAVEATPECLTVEITDEGRGFNTAKASLIDPDSMPRQCGRGLALIHMVMDEVSFNPKGNQIRMCLHRKDRPQS